jgi:hypothetical protein
MDCAYTWSSKQVHWLSQSHWLHPGSSHYQCIDKLALLMGLAQVGLPITEIHTLVVPTSKIPWILAALRKITWMHDTDVCDGSIEDILILNPMDVKEVYSHIGSGHDIIQWHVHSYRWHDASIGCQ